MLRLLLLITCVSAAVEEYVHIPEDPYNADTLVKNLDEMRFRINCLLDRGPCTELIEAYKKLIPDAVRQECKQCSSYLKHYHNVFVKALKEQFPEDYPLYRKKFDPEGKHFDAMEAAVYNF